jgi:mRNA-degrading endonuclease toxin of MazEF toxin-antitoxin module
MHSLDVCVLPISTAQHKAFSLRPRLQAGEGGLLHESWVKCDQPSTIEKDCVLFPPLGKLSGEAVQMVEAAVRDALELP